jgi:hypothetical protein
MEIESSLSLVLSSAHILFAVHNNKIYIVFRLKSRCPKFSLSASRTAYRLQALNFKWIYQGDTFVSSFFLLFSYWKKVTLMFQIASEQCIIVLCVLGIQSERYCCHYNVHFTDLRTYNWPLRTSFV